MRGAAGAEPLVRVVRSGLEESVHLGCVAVSDAAGRLVAWAGDSERLIYARSAMKPLQAAVSLHAIGIEELSDREIAVMCASHNGEAVHVDTVGGILSRADLGFDALRCPPGWPLDPERMAQAGRRRPELHNCSGKHAGMLLACARQGWDVEAYLEPSHPLQQRILEAVRLVTEETDIALGVDGCGAPVFGMSLYLMAKTFARFGALEGWGDLAPETGRVARAMLAEPYFVAGRNRIDTAVMETTGNVLVKVGAEGLVCAAVLEQRLGVAVKILDGSSRADGPALVHALTQLGALDAAQVELLQEYARPPVFGGGMPVGELFSSFDLRRA